MALQTITKCGAKNGGGHYLVMQWIALLSMRRSFKFGK